MVTISLDAITRNVLLRKSYPIHWYMQCLLYAKDCLRQLVEDDLEMTNTKILPVDLTTNTAQLPNDYLDYVLVAYQNGQYVVPLVESTGLDALPNYDTDWNEIKNGATNVFTNNLAGNTNLLLGPYGFSQWFTTHYNNFGENTGRFYGGIAYYDTFTVIKKRNVIKLNNAITKANIALVYISNGMDSSTATQITPYAQDTIEAYIMWQLKEQNRSYGIGERQVAESQYINQRKILRARLSDLSISKLKRIIHRTTMASPKN